jgi:hypothetical protein
MKVIVLKISPDLFISVKSRLRIAILQPRGIPYAMSIKNSYSTWTITFPASIKIQSDCTRANAETSTKCTVRGIVIDPGELCEKANDVIRFNYEFNSNKNNEVINNYKNIMNREF